MGETLPLDFYVPVSNGADTLGACLEALLAQTARPRAIRVYAGARFADATLAVARRYPVDVRTVEQPPGSLRQLALEEAQTEWLGSCGADVAPEPDWLERLWAGRGAGGGAGVAERIAIVGGQTLERGRTTGDRLRGYAAPRSWGGYPLRNPEALGPDMIARVAALRAVGGYVTRRSGVSERAGRDDRGGSDEPSEGVVRDVCLRLRRAGYMLSYTPAARALRLRSDTALAVLDFLWREWRLHRTAGDGDEEALAAKQLDNTAEGTRVWHATARDGDSRVRWLAALLPAHHFLRDAGGFGAGVSWATPADSLARQLPAVLVYALRAVDGSFAAEAEWITAPAMLVHAFLEHYARFLLGVCRATAPGDPVFARAEAVAGALPAPQRGGNPRRPDDGEWTSAALDLRLLVADQCAYAPGLEDAADPMAEAERVLAAGTAAALLGVRQRLYPDGGRVPTARALVELTAKHGRDIAAMRTFQGSTLIAAVRPRA